MKSIKMIVSVFLAALMMFSVACSSGDSVESFYTDKSENSTIGSDETDKMQDSSESEKNTEKENDTPTDSVGLDITDKTKVVSICYSMWFDTIAGGKIYDISDILARNSANATDPSYSGWGNYGTFHYWSEPALGYYKSSDKSVIRTHMTQLAEAGVDFIILDNTNANYNSWKADNYWKRMVSDPCKAICDTILEMRSEGKETPYVVFWNRTESDCGWSTCEAVYKEFYANGKYDDCWVYWDGKPLMLCASSSYPNSLQLRLFRYASKLTLRDMTVTIFTGPRPATNQWTFISDSKFPCKDENKEYEQMSVYTARQSDYMSNTSTAVGRNGGKTFQKQWLRVFQHDPKIVTITWWNEWAAQRQRDRGGRVTFVDNYTQEYSRDIEPMKGGHGDKYYQWMKQYISAYKAGEDCPMDLID